MNATPAPARPEPGPDDVEADVAGVGPEPDTETIGPTYLVRNRADRRRAAGGSGLSSRKPRVGRGW